MYFFLIVLYYLSNDVIGHYYKRNINAESDIQHIGVIETIHQFMLFIFSTFLLFSFYHYWKSKINTYDLVYISFIFIKYSSVFYFHPNISQNEYELHRWLMWLFTTPSILHIFTKVNQISFFKIHSEYHLIPNLFAVLLHPFKDSFYMNYFYALSYLSQTIFLYHLSQLKEYRFVRMFISFWCLFGFIQILYINDYIDEFTSNILFGICDLMVKFMSMLIIYDSEIQRFEISQLTDLQCLQLVSSIYHTMNEFKKHNDLSKNCNSVYMYIIDHLKHIIITNTNNKIVKLELLQKILPYDFDDKYLMTNIKKYRHLDNICVLFTDIVSYSDYSNQHNDIDVYLLLNDMYIKFDYILRRYKNIQKIETIGDSYMVVSNISKEDQNQEDIHQNVLSMIQIAHEFIDSLKYLHYQTEIQIRIGIHIGPVVIGILGLDIPRLCVIGNTVNFASRLQTTSEPNKIQISREIYDKIEDKSDFEFKENQDVILKNIGEMNTFFVHKS